MRGSGTNAINAENLANVENYGSNLVIDLIQRGVHTDVKAVTGKPDTARMADNVKRQLESEGGISEEQMIMLVLSEGDRHMVEDVRAVGGKFHEDQGHAVCTLNARSSFQMLRSTPCITVTSPSCRRGRSLGALILAD